MTFRILRAGRQICSGAGKARQTRLGATMTATGAGSLKAEYFQRKQYGE